MKKKLIPLLLTLMVCTGCTEFAMLSSGATVAISHNAYAKAYSGVDLLTIMQTDKDIKRHIYDQVRRLDKTKKKESD